jgi:hypothetical protein
MTRNLTQKLETLETEQTAKTLDLDEQQTLHKSASKPT